MLGDAGDEFERLAHGAACYDQASLGRPRGELGPEPGDFLPQPLALGGFAEREHDFVRPERLGEIVVGALFHGGDGGILTAVRAHDDDERPAPALAIVAQEGETIHLGHPHIAEDQIEGLGCGTIEGTPAVLLGCDGVARVRQQQAERLAQARFVVDNQDFLHRGNAIGKKSLKAAPPSRAASTHTTPPISWTDRATIASPRPVPRPGSLVV